MALFWSDLVFVGVVWGFCMIKNVILVVLDFGFWILPKTFDLEFSPISPLRKNHTRQSCAKIMPMTFDLEFSLIKPLLKIHQQLIFSDFGFWILDFVL